MSRVAAAYWFSIAFWAFIVGSQPYSIGLLSAFWWGWFLHLGCTFIPVLFFHFAVVFTNAKGFVERRVLSAAYGITVLFNLLNLATKLFTSEAVYRDAYAYPKPALLYPAYFSLFVILVIWGTALIIKYLRYVPAYDRPMLKLMLVAHVLAYLGAMDNFLIMVDIRIPPLYPYGLYLIPPYAFITLYTVHRIRVISRAGVLTRTASA